MLYLSDYEGAPLDDLQRNATLTLQHMDFLSLNDDVLRSIADKLYGKNALNLALTSRRIHDLAVHRVSAVIVCPDGPHLRLAHRHLFFGSRPRVQYLESFTVLHYAFKLDHDIYESRSRSPPWDDEAYDWSQVRLLVDILMNARNLRIVALPLFHPTMLYDSPRLADALCALPKLTSVQLDTVGDTIVTTIVPRLPRSLRILELQYHAPIGDSGLYLYHEPKTFPALLDTVAAFPALHTLRLKCFHETGPSFRELGHTYTPPLLSAVRALVLLKISPPALDIVQLCPNLTDLEFGLWTPGYLREGARWPALRSLDVHEFGDLPCAMGLLGPVRCLVIRQYMPVSDPPSTGLAVLLDALERTAPRALFLSLKVGKGPMTFWGEVAARAPNLRVLELKLNVNTEGLTLDSLGWLDAVPEALRPLSASLVLVRILLPRMPEYRKPLDTRQELAARSALVATVEEDRARAARTLPQRLANALPALRFLEVCEARPSFRKPTKSQDEDWVEDDEQPGAGFDEEEDTAYDAEEDVWEAEEMRFDADEDEDYNMSDDEYFNTGRNEYCDMSEDEYSDASEDSGWGARLEAMEDQGDPGKIDVQRPQVAYGWIDNVAYRRWWRVRQPSGGDVQGRTLEEISEAELERAQRFLEEVGDEQVARVDDL